MSEKIILSVREEDIEKEFPTSDWIVHKTKERLTVRKRSNGLDQSTEAKVKRFLKFNNAVLARRNLNKEGV